MKVKNYNLESCGCSSWYIEAHAMCLPSIKNQEGIDLDEVIMAANLKKCHTIIFSLKFFMKQENEMPWAQFVTR